MSFTQLSNLSDLDIIARAAGIAPTVLKRYYESERQADYYSKLRIPKRKGSQFRVVFKAKHNWLADFHRTVAIIVHNSTQPSSEVHGFVKGRSTYTNARQHLGAKRLLHADIVGFFDSVTKSMVQAAFKAAGTSREAAEYLATLCTIDGVLGQGTRCAPAIANLVCADLDSEMLELAGKYSAVYSRYADDITFSGDRVPESEEVTSILSNYGFKLRDGKCILQSRGRNQYVTGLTIADKQRPRLPRKLKRRLRLIFHYIQEFGVEGHASHLGLHASDREIYALDGMLSYVNSVEPALAVKWRHQLNTGRRLDVEKKRRER